MKILFAGELNWDVEITNSVTRKDRDPRQPVSLVLFNEQDTYGGWYLKH